MKKLLATLLTVCMLATMYVVPVSVFAAFEGFDFDSAYTFNNYQSKYYISSNGMKLFLTSAGNDKAAAESLIVYENGDSGNKVLIVPTQAHLAYGISKNSVSFKFKKTSATGTFSPIIHLGAWTVGSNRGSTQVKIFTLNESGEILANNGSVVGTFNVGEWYDVSVRFSDDRTKANVIITNESGMVTLAPISLSSVTISSDATLASLELNASSGNVVLDNLEATTDTSEFVFKTTVHGTDSDLDFEGTYTWNSGYHFPYISKNSTNYFFSNFGSSSDDAESAKACVITDTNGDKVYNIPSSANGSMNFVHSGTNKNTYEFKIKKTALGTFAVNFRNNVYGQGNNNGGKNINILKLDESGNVITYNGNVAGEYSADSWYTVKMRKSDDQASWNISLTNDETGDIIYAPLMYDGTITSSGNAALVIINSGSEVYIDDITTGLSSEEFALEDPNGIYRDFSTDADIDFEDDDESFVTGYNSPYLSINSTMYFFSGYSADENGVAQVKDRFANDSDGNSVYSLTNNSSSGINIVHAGSAKNSYQFRLRKSADGIFAAYYRNNAYTHGGNNGGTQMTLFTLEADGTVKTHSGYVAGSYSANEWYTVSLTRDLANANTWNIVLEDTNGNKIYAPAVASNELTPGEKSSVVLINAGSEVYLDDIITTLDETAFELKDPDGIYSEHNTDADLDLEDPYTFITDYNFPRFEINGVRYFFAAFDKADVAGAESTIIKDNGDKVISIPAGNEMFRMVTSKSAKNKFMFNVKKIDAAGTFTVTYRTSTYGQGAGNGHSDITLFKMNADGTVTNYSGVNCGSYTPGVWYSVTIIANQGYNMWNVVLEDFEGNKINLPVVFNGTPAIKADASNSALLMTNSDSTVYVDDLSTLKVNDSFVLNDSEGLYTYATDLSKDLTSNLTAGAASSVSVGAYTFGNEGNSNITVSPYTDSKGRVAAKIVTGGHSGSSTSYAKARVKTSLNKSNAPFSLKFTVGAEKLMNEFNVQMMLHNGTSTFRPTLLEFEADGVLKVYSAGGSIKNDAETVVGFKWEKGVLYDCELVYDVANKIYMFYITDDKGNTYAYDILSAMNQKYVGCYIYGINLYFRGSSEGIAYMGDSSLDIYTPNCEFVNTTPANGSEMVSLIDGIKVNYSDYLLASAVDNVTATLVSKEGTEVEITKSIEGKSVVITPVGSLEKGTIYTVTVSGAKDLYGNVAPDSVASSFETSRGFDISNITLNGSETGTPIKGMNTAKATVYAGDTNYSALLIVAAYDKITNEMIGTGFTPYSIGYNEPAKEISAELDLSAITSSDYYVDVFVWDSMDKIKPYIPKVTFGK